MNHFPLVSIITVTYNAEKHLEETILSILGQSYKNIEYLIIDGGSTDGTIDIIKKYESKLAYWVSEPDNGMYSAINKGFAKAKGEIYSYLNADDVYFQDTIETVIDAYKKYNADLIYGTIDFVAGNGNKLYNLKIPNFSKKQICWLQRLPFDQPATFWTGKSFHEIGGFDEKYKLSSDAKFLYSYIIGDKYKVHALKKQVVKFRRHEDALSSKFEEKLLGERTEILKEFGLLDESLLGVFRKYLTEMMFKLKNVKKYINYNLLKNKG